MGAPFTSRANRDMLAKIIVIYTIFYVIMKVIAIFQGAWLVANLLLCVPFIALGLWGGMAIKQKQTTWLFVLLAVVLISFVRYYEVELMGWLHQSV